MPASANTVLVLGANGRFGRAAVEAFGNAGWTVLAQSRTPPRQPLPANAVGVQCDALDVERLVRACAGGVTVIVNALNPAYTEWERRVPALADAALRTARATGALLMLPGNVYNFGSRLPATLTEETPFVADTPKARIRIALERQMRAASNAGVKSVVIRAGDFLGGAGPGTWLDMVIAKKLHRRRFTYLGPLDVPHAWAYLPDLARVFVAVAGQRDRLQPFEVFHYAGITCTGSELWKAMENAAGSRLGLTQMPWWPLRLLAPVAPICRALLEMRYLWQRPHRLDEAKLARLIGHVPHTPLEQVLEASLAAMHGQGEKHPVPA